jgi:hypothetical protein
MHLSSLTFSHAKSLCDPNTIQRHRGLLTLEWWQRQSFVNAKISGLSIHLPPVLSAQPKSFLYLAVFPQPVSQIETPNVIRKNSPPGDSPTFRPASSVFLG